MNENQQAIYNAFTEGTFKHNEIIKIFKEHHELLDNLSEFYSQIPYELLFNKDFVLKVNDKIYNEYKTMLTKLFLLDELYSFDKNNILYCGIKVEKL